MLYFKEQNLVFLANPKTGTSAIETALADRAGLVATDPPGLRHMNVAIYRKEVEPLLKRFARGVPPRVFVVIREPISRLLSWYRYRQRFAPGIAPDRHTDDIGPEEFLEEVMKDDPRPFARDLGNQAAFCGLATGLMPPDYIFPYEHPSALADFLRAEFGLTHLDRVNVSPGGATQLPASLQDRLRKHLADDYALYAGVLKRHGLRPGTTAPARDAMS